MKIIIKTLFIILFAVPAAWSQKIDAETLTRDLREIITNAASGFPRNNGLTSDDPYIKTYGTDLSLFGISKYASLEYEPAHDYKYAKPTNELFYFKQIFTDTSAAGKFMFENGEAILDAQGETQGLKKVVVKQDKQYRKMFEVIEYRQLNKPLFTFTRYLQKNHVTLQVFSPFRPGDVKVANLLGCMVFSSPYSGFLNVVPIYGSTLGDKEKVADAAYAKSGLTERRYQYEWLPGTTPKQVQLKWEKKTTVTVLNAYTVE